MWDFKTIERFAGALRDTTRKNRTFCSIKHSINEDIVVFKNHAFSKFIDGKVMTESELLCLFMAIMYVWDDAPGKKCEGSRNPDTYEKSFFLNKDIFQKYCIPFGTNYNPCGYRVVYNKIRLGEGKREYSVFCVKKLGSRDLTTERVHNNKGCYIHAGIPDEHVLARKESRKLQKDNENSEIRDLREEVIRLRKRSRIESEYHYGPPQPPLPADSHGPYAYYHPHGSIPPSYPRLDTSYESIYSKDIPY